MEKLCELLDAELGFVAPALEALQQLQLGPDLQDKVGAMGVCVCVCVSESAQGGNHAGVYVRM